MRSSAPRPGPPRFDPSHSWDRSWQVELRLQRGKIAVDVGLEHLAQARRVPARRIVLVDDHGAYAFIEVGTVDDTRDDAKFRLHTVGKRPLAAAAKLRQSDLEAQRRLAADRRRGGARPASLGAVRDRFAIERLQDVLDPIGGKQAIERLAIEPQRADAEIFAEDRKST